MDLAITQEKNNMVGFTPNDNWQQAKYTFGSGRKCNPATTPQHFVVRRGPK